MFMRSGDDKSIIVWQLRSECTRRETHSGNVDRPHLDTQQLLRETDSHTTYLRIVAVGIEILFVFYDDGLF